MLASSRVIDRRPIVLAIDAVGIRSGGGMSVLLALLEEALKRDFLSIVLFATPEFDRDLKFPCHPRLSIVERPLEFAHPGLRLWWFEQGFRLATKAIRANVSLCLTGAAIPSTAIPGVTLIQQSLPFSREALDCLGRTKRAKLRLLRSYMQRACVRSKAVLVQTRTMNAAVSAAFLLPQAKVFAALTMPPVLVAAPTPDLGLSRMRATPRASRVLYVGSDLPYKNLSELRAALPLLSDMVDSPTLFLTTPPTGRGNHRIVELGPLPPGPLAEAYSLADVLVLPSLTETVGLPMIEAMRAGVPVCAADRPYAQEICGKAAVYMDPASPRDIAASVRRVLTDVSLRRSLIEQGKEQIARLAAHNGYATMLDILVGAVPQCAGMPQS